MATIFDSYMSQKGNYDPTANSGSYAFKSDVSQRRQLVPSAHKKPKKSGCSLPSDNLTAAQRKKLNGDVIQCNLSKPMSMNEFRNLSDDIKKEYLNKLLHEMGTTAKNISNMLGCSPDDVRKILINLGVKTHPKFYQMTSDQKKAWDEFIGDFSNKKINNKSKQKKTSKITKNKEAIATAVEEIKAVSKPKLVVGDISFSIKATSWSEIADMLKGLDGYPIPKNIQITIDQ